MSDKERLEEIRKTEYQIMEISKTNMQADFNYLLNYISEQAERFEEMKLEFADDIDFKRRQVNELEQQNKHYLKTMRMVLSDIYDYDFESARTGLRRALESESE